MGSISLSLELVATIIASILGLLAGPRISWAIRAWPGHESFHCDYLKCHECEGGIRRGCHNAGIAQDRLYALYSASMAGMAIVAWGIGTKALLSWVFCVSCLIITVVDVRFLIIPDTLSVRGCWAGLAYTGLSALWVRFGYAPPQHYITFADSFVGFMLGGGFLWFLGWLAWILLKREGMGGGDVKLLAAIGAWMGWKPVIATIVIASFLGSFFGVGGIIYRRVVNGTKYKPLSHMIPFGPYLCLGFLITFFLGMDPLYRIVEVYQTWFEGYLHQP